MIAWPHGTTFMVFLLHRLVFSLACECLLLLLFFFVILFFPIIWCFQVYLDTHTLKQNALGLKDFKEIVIQRTPAPEHLTGNHLLLTVREWWPEAATLGPSQEMAFLGTQSVADAKAALRATLMPDVPLDVVQVTV
jgi:hypothetical protein